VNATQVAIHAGYSAKTAYRIGAELLQKTSVSAALNERMKAREERTQIDWLVRLVFHAPPLGPCVRRTAAGRQARIAS